MARTPAAKASTPRATKVRGRDEASILGDLNNVWTNTLQAAASAEGLKGRAATMMRTKFNAALNEYKGYTEGLVRQLTRTTKRLQAAAGGGQEPAMASKGIKGTRSASAATRAAPKAKAAIGGGTAGSKSRSATATRTPRSAAASTASRSQSSQQKAKAGSKGGAARAGNRNPSGPRATTGTRGKGRASASMPQQASEQHAAPMPANGEALPQT
jgi:hypothetical protein